MRQICLLLGLLWGGFLLPGCGSSYHYTPGQPASGQPDPQPPAPATIIVEHVLARAVPNTVDSFRFTGTDQRGNTVLGPVVRPRTSEVRITPVPLTTTTFSIEYLSGQDVSGRFSTDVSLQPGQTLRIANPAWVDVYQFGPASQLSVRVTPGSSAPTLALTPALVIEVLDAQGRLVENSTAPIGLALEPASASLGGTTTVNAQNGIATFSDLSIDQAGSFRLVASSAGLTSVQSQPIEIVGEPTATALSFTLQPADGAAQLADVEVQVLDQFGDPFTDYTGVVSLSLGTNASGSTLTGTTEVAASQGIARFSGLGLTVSGQDFTLIASAPNLTPATSTAFDVTLGQLQRSLFSIVTPVQSQGALGPHLVTGDFNGDGRTDSLAVSEATQQAVLLLQTEDGDFREKRLNVAGIKQARSGDINGDGHLDLITLEEAHGAAQVSVRLGLGDSTFSAPSALSLGTLAPASLELADLNGDGSDDLILSGLEAGTAHLGVSLSNGSSLSTLTLVALDGAPTTIASLATGRFDGSGNLGVIALTSTTAQLFSGDGAGGLTYLSSLSPGSDWLQAVAVADFNADDQDDIVLGRNSSGPVVLAAYLSNAGSYSQPSGGTFSTDHNFLSAGGLAAGDFDGDGVPEIVSIVRGTDSNATSDLRLHKVAPTGAPFFASAVYINISLNTPGLGVTTADLNNDGQLDIGVVRQGDVIRVNGDGQGNLLPTPLAGPNFISYAAGDLNGDGRSELVAAAAGVTTVYRKSAVSDELTPSQVLGSSSLVALGDADGDGSLDVFLGQTSGVTYFTNDGTGQMTEAGQFSTTFTFDTMELGDLNGDGCTDLVLGSVGSSTFSVVLSNGPASYDSPLYHSVTAPLRGLSLGDIDGDGTLDIVAGLGPAGLEVMTNTDQAFTSNLFPLGGLSADAVAARDLNGDGLTDVAVASAGGAEFGTLTTVFNEGNLTLVPSAPLRVPGLRNPSELRVQDANGDSILDLLVVDRDAYGCAIYTGLGDGQTYTSGSLLFAGGQPQSTRSLVFVDLDGDGVVEPLFAHFTSSGATAASFLAMLGLIGANALRRRRRAA